MEQAEEFGTEVEGEEVGQKVFGRKGEVEEKVTSAEVDLVEKQQELVDELRMGFEGKGRVSGEEKQLRVW